ncbi:hypothetical protein BDN70DRAFT_6258 [Pholiota conissans]|uniref:Uncharacterized protein n=1 Tax=Pholiota conissans TaxID=109636 RepID=A0A9P5ZFW5_9AGAR|nr:hypothetical protein BDN70DRAFT_6258 [Pholiota conissans]
MASLPPPQLAAQCPPALSAPHRLSPPILPSRHRITRRPHHLTCLQDSPVASYLARTILTPAAHRVERSFQYYHYRATTLTPSRSLDAISPAHVTKRQCNRRMPIVIIMHLYFRKCPLEFQTTHVQATLPTGSDQRPRFKATNHWCLARSAYVTGVLTSY